jgi:hypothetical protein
VIQNGLYSIRGRQCIIILIITTRDARGSKNHTHSAQKTGVARRAVLVVPTK